MRSGTIFISILSGVEAKDILRTNVVQGLLNAGHKVVLFLKSAERADFYKKEFNHPNLIYEVAGKFLLSKGDDFFEFFKNYLVRTTTIFLHKKINFLEDGNYAKYALSLTLSLLLGNGFFRKAARFFDLHFIFNNSFSNIFEKYNPSLVFLANLFDPMEIAILREAKKWNIKTVGFINSWDKITSRGHIRILPDKLIVPNEIVRKEAKKYLGIKNAFISGVPQYDHYVNGAVALREDFFKKIKADPKKNLLLFAPLGSAWSDSDWDMIDLLFDLSQKKVFKRDVEILVRFPPNDFAHEKNIKKRPHLHCDIPGIRFATSLGMDWDMGYDDLEHLRNTLRHCAMVIGYSSSIAIDAAFCGKPAVGIGFTVREAKPGKKDPIMRYKTEHYKKALRSGGIRLVKSQNELVEWINKYLENPKIDEEGRQRLVMEQCYKIDGRAGERISNFLLENLQDA